MAITKIETVTLGSDSASITFSSIPQTYTDLMIVLSVRTSNTEFGQSVRVRPNGSTTNGSERVLRAFNGSSVSSYTDAYAAITDNQLGSGATANTFGSAQLYIPNYTSTTANKSMSSEGVSETNAAGGRLDIIASLWASTAAITSIVLDNSNGYNLNTGTSATLYGILKGSSGGVTVS